MFNKNDILKIKREVKRVDKINIKDIVGIISLRSVDTDTDEVTYSFYNSNYDRTTNNSTYKTILIKSVKFE